MTEDVVRVAKSCLDSIKQTKARDFPPSTREIEALMSGQGLTVSVNCVGGRVIDIPVTSSTSCLQIIEHIKNELALTSCRNGFGLFESCGGVSKYLEEKVSGCSCFPGHHLLLLLLLPPCSLLYAEHGC